MQVWLFLLVNIASLEVERVIREQTVEIELIDVIMTSLCWQGTLYAFYGHARTINSFRLFALSNEGLYQNQQVQQQACF